MTLELRFDDSCDYHYFHDSVNPDPFPTLSKPQT